MLELEKSIKNLELVNTTFVRPKIWAFLYTFSQNVIRFFPKKLPVLGSVDPSRGKLNQFAFFLNIFITFYVVKIFKYLLLFLFILIIYYINIYLFFKYLLTTAKYC